MMNTIFYAVYVWSEKNMIKKLTVYGVLNCKQNGYKTGITKIREVVVTDKQSDMELLTLNEIQMINGGKLETVSDWLLLGGSICMCFAAPQVGVPMTIAVAVWA